MQLQEIPSAQDRLVLSTKFSAIAPIDLYPYFSTPEGLTKWWPQEAEVDLNVGSGYALRWPAMNWTLSGMYKAIEPGKVLMFTWAWQHEPDLPTRDVSLMFANSSDDTELTVIHGFYSQSEKDQIDRKSHYEGWAHFLRQLAGILSCK